MKRSRVRIGLFLLIILGASGIGLYNLTQTVWLDDSLDGRVSQLGSGWTSSRRAAASDLARFSPASEKAVPALAKALDDQDVEVRRNALESLFFFGENSRTAGPASGGG